MAWKAGPPSSIADADPEDLLEHAARVVVGRVLLARASARGGRAGGTARADLVRPSSRSAALPGAPRSNCRMVLSEGIWPSGWIRHKSSQQALPPWRPACEGSGHWVVAFEVVVVKRKVR